MTEKYYERFAQLSVNDLRRAITKVNRRIQDLNEFNVDDLRSGFDMAPNLLKKKINYTLQEILGHDTKEYSEFSIDSLHTLNLIFSYTCEDVQDNFRRGINCAVIKLTSLRDFLNEKLEDMEFTSAPQPEFLTPAKIETTEIFIVHGRDEAAKNELEQFITELGLKPVVLHRKPDEGLTIIEKFEKHSKVGFALILLTPDDTVTNPDGTVLKRARQNVIFEMGFFVAKLGRGRVCCVKKEDVEVPSDISGVIYKSFRNHITEAKYPIMQELRAAGYKVSF